MRRPITLLLVYGASVAVIGVSCAALALIGSEHVTISETKVTVAADQAAISDLVTRSMTADEFATTNPTPERQVQIDQALSHLADSLGLMQLTILRADGTTLARAVTATGSPAPMAERQLTSARAGVPDAMIVPGEASGASATLSEALPLLQDGEVRLIVHVVRDARPIMDDASEAWRDVIVVVVGAALVLAILLHRIFRAAATRLIRQDEALADARRRDQLTGLLNHGTVVALLTDQIESAKTDQSSIGVALVDIDNFRLLNDVHGDPAGDEAMLLVAVALGQEASAWSALGRYGPDEFLAVALDSSARDLEAAMKRVRDRLDGVDLEFAGSERLPLTVSVGISYFPFHANAVTELLSAATIALGEAKSSGGNGIRIANAWMSEPPVAQTTFDVLEGLVGAIDTKDRYTKRHSEDVARYALFLAGLIELPDELRLALRLAGLLHDVGKIGIPDDILRKPGPLTPREYDIVKQHVALGDLIVRDLPDLELVRAGVRYHHERWDGDGYLDGLRGEEIPLIARILAVGDAFSAMTTTRPYRKALSVEEALGRLEDAAGTQLEARLVQAFVTGIQTDPAAPLPGAEGASSRLWTPGDRAA